MRSISRVCDVSFNTVAKILADAGKVCMTFHDEKVRKLRSRRVQVDEIWSFCAAKQKNVQDMKKPVDRAGDVWTWTALDADSKLIVSWLVGDRDSEHAQMFMHDVADRIDQRTQVTSDGLRVYVEATMDAFGGFVDYAQLVKIYGQTSEGQRRYSPPECVGATKVRISGRPKPEHISTSYVERSNLTLRMQNRRFTRLTNAFSKKFESHVDMVALYTVWYNWIRIHKTLRTTPAMAANLTTTLMGFEDIVALIDAAAPKPGRPTKYKKSAANA